MMTIPQDVLAQFEDVLKQRAVPVASHADYRKWLRYFLDFRSKYPLPDSRSEQVRLFIEKLRAKKQTPKQQNQAAHAVSLFFALQEAKKPVSSSLVGAVPSPRLPQTSAYKPRNVSEAERTIPPRMGDSASKDGNRTASASSNSSTSSARRSTGGKQFNEWRCLEKTQSPTWDKIIDELATDIKMRHYSRKTLKAYADWGHKFQRFLRDKPPDELSTADVKAYLAYLAVTCKVSASTQNQAFNALLFLYRHILKKDFGDHRDIPRAKKSRYIPVVLCRQEIDTLMKHLEYPCNITVKLLYGCGLRLFECVKLRVKNFNFEAGILTVHGKGNKDRTVPIPQTIVPELTAQLEVVKKLHDKNLAAGYAGVFLEVQLGKNILPPGMIYTRCVPSRTVKEAKSPLDF